MLQKEIIQDLILRGFKISSIREQLNISGKDIKPFVIHPSRSEIAAYQITYIREHYSADEIRDSFLKLKKTKDMQTMINRCEYYTLGCAFGLFKTVFETLMGPEDFGKISNEFRRQKTENTVMERYGVTSISKLESVKEKKLETMKRNGNSIGVPSKRPKKQIVIKDEIIAQVKELSLRGFKRSDIRIKLNLSWPVIQQIGFSPSIEDIVEYQVQYIREHYSAEEIVETLTEIRMSENFQAKANCHELYAFGCAFGSLAKPFSKLLGITNYRNLINSQTKERQKSQGVLDGKWEKRRQTMLEFYGVEHPNQNPEILNHMMETLRSTNQLRYGVDYVPQVPEIAKAISKKRQETMMKRYGASNSTQIPEIREKILESRRKNGTLSTSMYEVEVKRLLIERFGENDVQCSVKVDDRYPYYVDFYIPSRDLFIELNYDASHGRHWFDPKSEKDVAKLLHMQEKAEGPKRPSRYRNNIHVWTVSDPEKRACAKNHNLNYLVFWDSKTYVQNHKTVPRLQDFHAWLDAGCPNAMEWPDHIKNTYE